MMPIDIRYVDVDFRLEVPEDRATGCLKESADEMRLNAPCPRFAEMNRIIPRSEWYDLSRELEEELRSGVMRRHDQDGEGSCVSHATTYAMEYRAYFALGIDHWVALSPMSLYKRIGESAQSGAFISDGAKYSQLEGVLPLEGSSAYEHTHPEIGWRNPLPLGWQKTAKLFRAEWQRVDTVEEVISACLQFKPVLVGRRGHAIMYFLPHFDQGGMYIGYANSWGDWGDILNDTVGRCLGWDTERNMARTGYCCENITIRSEVPLP